MQFTKNGVSVTVPDALVIDFALRALGDEELAFDKGAAPPLDPPPPHVVPAIGSMWVSQGGIYAGVIRGRDGGPDCHLILGPEYDGDVNWDDATAWATALRVDDGLGFKLTNYSLPYRNEQALLFANLREHFKERVHWSREQHAEDSSNAYTQDFDYGYQDDWHKGSELRARAVRRFPI